MHVDSVQSTIPVSKETRTNALTKWYQVDCKRCKNVRGIPVSLSVKVHTSNQIPMIIYIYNIYLYIGVIDMYASIICIYIYVCIYIYTIIHIYIHHYVYIITNICIYTPYSIIYITHYNICIWISTEELFLRQISTPKRLVTPEEPGGGGWWPGRWTGGDMLGVKIL